MQPATGDRSRLSGGNLPDRLRDQLRHRNRPGYSLREQEIPGQDRRLSNLERDIDPAGNTA
jgi:hypothetical protein